MMAKGTANQNEMSAIPNGPGRCQQGDRVGAHGEERHEAQVEEARQAQRDVEAQAHEDVEGDEGHGLGHEGTHAQRQPDDEHQQDDRHGDGGDPSLLVGHRAHPLPDPKTDPGEVGCRDDHDGEERAGERQAVRREDRASLVREQAGEHGCPDQAREQAHREQRHEVGDDESAQDARQHGEDGADEAQHRSAEDWHPEAVDRGIALEREDVKKIGRDVGQE